MVPSASTQNPTDKRMQDYLAEQQKLQQRREQFAEKIAELAGKMQEKRLQGSRSLSKGDIAASVREVQERVQRDFSTVPRPLKDLLQALLSYQKEAMRLAIPVDPQEMAKTQTELGAILKQEREGGPREAQGPSGATPNWPKTKLR